MRKILLSFLFLLILKVVSAQNTFIKAYGTINNEGAMNIVRTTDGGILMMGGGGDLILMKTDANGELQWTRKYGQAGWLFAQMSATADGGGIVVGSVIETPASEFPYQGRVYLIKIAQNNAVQWTRTYAIAGSTARDQGGYVQQTTDNGYIVAANTHDSLTGFDRGYIMKTDSMGTPQWTKKFSSASGDVDISCVHQVADGNYVLSGAIWYGPAGNNIPFITKISANDTVMWSKAFTGANDSRTFKETTDQGFIMLGYGYIMKTDASGNRQWSKKTRGVTYSAVQADDGGFVFTGDSLRSYLYKLKGDGTPQWTWTYNNENLFFWLENIIKDTDGGYLIGASSNTFGMGYMDYSIVKTDSLGHAGCIDSLLSPPVYDYALNATGIPPVTDTMGIVTGALTVTPIPYPFTETILCNNGTSTNDLEIKNEFRVYPVPFNDLAMLESAKDLKNATLCIYNVWGQQVQKLEHVNGQTLTLKREGLTPGIYLAYITQDGKLMGSCKLMIGGN